MLSISFSILYWGFVFFSSLLLFLPAVLIWLLTVFIDPRLRLLHLFTSFWASLYTWLNPFWSVKIENREYLKSDAVYVIVSNHQSLVDILILFRLFAHYKWVSKVEIFRVPVVGWNMSLNRYIRITRGSVRSGMRMMNDCIAALKGGSSIVIFPEGTRSPTGKVRIFMEGAFELAKKTKNSILPIVIDGAVNALPKEGLLLEGKHKIRVRLLPPMPYEDFKDIDSYDLAESVRQTIAAEREVMWTE